MKPVDEGLPVVQLVVYIMGIERPMTVPFGCPFPSVELEKV